MTTPILSCRARHFMAAAAISSLLGVGAAGATMAGQAPLTWTFDKCATTPGLWQGTASAQGTTVSLTTRLSSSRLSGSVLHVTFDWEVGDEFVAPLGGTLNLSTGAVVMNGVIASGVHAGAQVHEEGQLYDDQRLCFAGTIRVMSASS